MITVLCGGVGAAKFLVGIAEAFRDEEIVAVVNVGDDEDFFGLHVSPDIDTILYTLSGKINLETGWGLKDETWNVSKQLRQLNAPTWFQLGDRDLATHLFRTGRLSQGADLTTITQELSQLLGVTIKVLPASNDRVRTRLITKEANGTMLDLSFQEYFVQRHHDVPIASIYYSGANGTKATPEVESALDKSRNIIIAPSNPILSIAPILNIESIGNAIAAMRDKVIAVSPIVAGKAIKGPADRIMKELGMDPSALGIAQYYKNFTAGMIIDEKDSSYKEDIQRLGQKVKITDTIMSDKKASIALASTVRAFLDAKAG